MDRDTLLQGLGSDVHRPTSVGALDGFGPVVVVAALQSYNGSVQPHRTDPRQKTR